MIKAPRHLFPAAAVLVTALSLSGSPGAQSSTGIGGSAQDAQVSGYWIDPATGLMWASRGNGRDVSWHKAIEYCHDLRLASYSDWGLPNMAELRGIYDSSVNAPGPAGPGKGEASTWHVKGNLFLTRNQWSSERSNDDRGHPSAYAWYFDFNEGKSNDQPSGFPYSSSFMHALCVRGSVK